MALSARQVHLAQTLRSLRESHWPDAELTQAQLAGAFSKEKGVTAATISTWESGTNPKSPNSERLRAYARFFATRRSIQGPTPRLIAEEDLTEAELVELRRMELRLFDELEGDSDERPSTFTFPQGPVTIICPKAPERVQGQFAKPDDPNFTKLQQYADLDALIEIHGHVRAANPTLDVFHRLASEAKPDDLSTHVILLGGVVWNRASRRFLHDLQQLPVGQIRDPELAEDDTTHDTGEIFRVSGGNAAQLYRPKWEDGDLVEDVALLARIPNPFNGNRTVTICNGVHSRGVLGAVRCLTDARVRDANEQYLTDRFPDDRFALLLRVPVIADEAISPDLQNVHTRLYEWPSEDGDLE